MSQRRVHFFIGVLVLCAGSAVQAVELITAKEAQLPDSVGALITRGIARGPGVKVVSPDPTGFEIKSPFDLKIEFESRGGKKVDPTAVRLMYLKANAVDLTPRLINAVTEKGINLINAEVPPGEHAVKVTVKDVEGRETNTVINLKIVK